MKYISNIRNLLVEISYLESSKIKYRIKYNKIVEYYLIKMNGKQNNQQIYKKDYKNYQHR